ncbi:MAG: hypothetical protein ACRKFN_11560 [Desulfitobacterium sp.]
MANNKEIRAMITLAGKIDPTLQKAMLKASGESLKLSANFNKTSKSMSSFATIAKGTFIGSLAAQGISRISNSIMGLASESLKLASDLKEVQNVVDTTFGKNAQQINSWSKAALNAFGLSELQAKQYTGTLGAMLKSSGIAEKDMLNMSQNLTGLSGDLASFYNLDHDEAFGKIRSGLSGETEPLKALGIDMSVANMEAFAMSKSIKASWNEMDKGSQAMLRYAYLMEATGDAQGDFAKTQGEYANQQRLFDTNLRQVSSTLASRALPYLNQLLKKGNKFLTSFDVDKAAEKVGLAFEYMGSGIKWARDNSYWLIPAVSGVAGSMVALQVIGTVSKLIDFFKVSTIAATFAQQGFNAALKANPIGIAVTAIGLLVAAGVALWKNWDTIIGKAKDLWDWFGKVTAPIKEFFNLGSDGGSGNAKSLAMQGFARGGIATQPSIFGEAGPEMAIPLQRTPRSLGLLNQTAKILGTGGSGANITINNYISSSGGDVKQIASATEDAIISVMERYFDNKVRVSYG